MREVVLGIGLILGGWAALIFSVDMFHPALIETIPPYSGWSHVVHQVIGWNVTTAPSYANRVVFFSLVIGVFAIGPWVAWEAAHTCRSLRAWHDARIGFSAVQPIRSNKSLAENYSLALMGLVLLPWFVYAVFIAVFAWPLILFVGTLFGLGWFISWAVEKHREYKVARKGASPSTAEANESIQLNAGQAGTSSPASPQSRIPSAPTSPSLQPHAHLPQGSDRSQLEAIHANDTSSEPAAATPPDADSAKQLRFLEPRRTSSQSTGTAGRTQISPARRREIEQDAIEHAMMIYRKSKLIQSVYSVESENKGWDLEAIVKEDSRQILIEVKGLSSERGTIEITANEYRAMQQFSNRYVLFVVVIPIIGKPHGFAFLKDDEAGTDRWTCHAAGLTLDMTPVKSARAVMRLDGSA